MIDNLVELGYACGASLNGSGWRCLRLPGHDGEHDRRGDKRVKSPEERLAWKLAKTRVRADHRERQREHLIAQIHMRDRQLERLMSHRLNRLAYRAVGGIHRLRRYRAQARRLAREWRW